MKKFETKYPVEGSAALQPKASTAPAHHARIIAFPVQRQARGNVRAVEAQPARTTLAAALHVGGVQGTPFGRMQRWQAVAGGCMFAAAALASLFIGM